MLYLYSIVFSVWVLCKFHYIGIRKLSKLFKSRSVLSIFKWFGSVLECLTLPTAQFFIEIVTWILTSKRWLSRGNTRTPSEIVRIVRNGCVSQLAVLTFCSLGLTAKRVTVRLTALQSSALQPIPG